MFNISSLLEKISKQINSGEIDRDQIISIIEKHTGQKIENNNVEIKDYIIYIKSSPSLKNRIFINKNKILEEIGGFSKTKIIDIK